VVKRLAGKLAQSLVVVTLVSSTFSHTATAGWELQWIDSFDGSGVDFSNWTAQTQADFNNEEQCYTADDSSAVKNYEVSGGTLKIIARRQAGSSACTGLGNANGTWTSGRLNSKDKQEFLYGRIESRLRMHNLQGGTWPAFWMLEGRINEQPIRGDGDNVPWNGPGAGEIDVWEWFSNDSANYIINFFNTSGCGGLRTYPYPGGSNDVLQWHDYAIEWTADTMRFLVDDIEVVSYDVTSCAQYKEPMFVLINLAMGGNLGGGIDPSLNLATLEIDYVAHCTATTSNTSTRCNESTPSTPTPTPTPTTPSVNIAPTVTSTANSFVNQGQVYRYTLEATDPEGDPLTFSPVTIPTWLTFDSQTTLLTGTPGADDVGSHRITLAVNDGTNTTNHNFTVVVLRNDEADNTPSEESSGGGGGSFSGYLLCLLGCWIWVIRQYRFSRQKNKNLQPTS